MYLLIQISPDFSYSYAHGRDQKAYHKIISEPYENQYSKFAPKITQSTKFGTKKSTKFAGSNTLNSEILYCCGKCDIINKGFMDKGTLIVYLKFQI